MLTYVYISLSGRALAYDSIRQVCTCAASCGAFWHVLRAACVALVLHACCMFCCLLPRAVLHAWYRLCVCVCVSNVCVCEGVDVTYVYMHYVCVCVCVRM
jgi:hypothetical protein